MVTMIGWLIRLFFCTAACTARAKMSVPPPAPAVTTNSTGFEGCQSAQGGRCGQQCSSKREMREPSHISLPVTRRVVAGTFCSSCPSSRSRTALQGSILARSPSSARAARTNIAAPEGIYRGMVDNARCVGSAEAGWSDNMVTMQAGVRVAVDIGGTFTDIVVMSGDGVLHESKVSTTPDDPSRAVVAGLDALLQELAIPAGRVEEVLHGTTVGSNTILQRVGRQDRADHHARLPRRAGDRAHPHARHVRPDLGQAQAAGAAPASAGGRRAHRRRRQRGRAAERGERDRGRRAAGGRRHRGGRHLPDQQLPQSRARAARRGDPARALPAACW